MSSSLHKRLDRLESRNKGDVSRHSGIDEIRVATIYADGVWLVFLKGEASSYFFEDVDTYRRYVSEYYPQEDAVREYRMSPDDIKAPLDVKQEIVNGWDAKGNLRTIKD